MPGGCVSRDAAHVAGMKDADVYDAEHRRQYRQRLQKQAGDGDDVQDGADDEEEDGDEDEDEEWEE